MRFSLLGPLDVTDSAGAAATVGGPRPGSSWRLLLRAGVPVPIRVLPRPIAGAIAKARAVVLSSEPVDARMDNAEVREAVLAVKNQPGLDIGAPGGIRTARTLIRLGLVDEYVLMMHPVAIGAGQGIFTGRADLTLTNAKAYASGVTKLTYRPR